MYLFTNQEFATQCQVCGRLRNGKAIGLCTAQITIIKVESKKFHFIFPIIYFGYENHTRKTMQVIRELYLPNSFDDHLGEWASINFQPW